MANRDIRVRFKGDTRDLDTAFGRVRRGADRTDKSVQGVGKSFGALKGAIVASGVLVVGTQIVRLGKQMFDLGSAVEETGSKFRTTFGHSSAAVDEFIATFGRMAGVTESEGQALLATTGAIAQGFGFAQDKSADFAQQIFRTAADMASFNNLPTDDVLQRITAALAGERESMKRLGVVIMETDVQARAFAMTGKSVAKQLTQQEKATATLALITERAAVAMGDLERTSGSSANVAKKAAADFRQLKEDIAVIVKDALVPLLQKISELGDFLNNNRDDVRRWSTFFVAAVVGAINLASQSFERFIALANIAIGLQRTFNPVVRAGEAIAAGDVGVAFTLEGLRQAREGLDQFKDATERSGQEFAKWLATLGLAEAEITGLVGPMQLAGDEIGSGITAPLKGATSEAIKLADALEAVASMSLADVFAEAANEANRIRRETELMRTALGDFGTPTDLPRPLAGLPPIDPDQDVIFGGLAGVTLPNADKIREVEVVVTEMDRAWERLGDSMDRFIADTIVNVATGLDTIGDAFLSLVRQLLRELAQAASAGGGGITGFLGDLLNLGKGFVGGGGDFGGQGATTSGGSSIAPAGLPILSPSILPPPTSTIIINAAPTLNVSAIDASDFNDRLEQHGGTLTNMILEAVSDSDVVRRGLR